MRYIPIKLKLIDTPEDIPIADRKTVCSGRIERLREYAKLNEFSRRPDQSMFGERFVHANGNVLVLW